MYTWPFRRKVRLIWWLLCTLVLASIPYTLWEFKEAHYSLQYIGWTFSGIFVLLTIPVTVYQVALHVHHYNDPDLQRHVVRILLMVPIYAMVSWFSLRWSSCRKWFSPFRECYEAVVLYSFYCYLIGCLQRQSGNYEVWLSQLPPQAPHWPFNGELGRWLRFRVIEDGREFMYAMRRGVLLYVFVRPTLALTQMLCMLFGVWGEGHFTFSTGWLWCMLVNNVTQFCSVYSLVALYHATHEQLAAFKPLRKFILIKMVVFFTFWQGFLISILGSFHLIGKARWSVYDTKQLASGIQDVIICIECLPASLMFAIVFPARDYMRPGEPLSSVFENIVNMFDIRDLGRDVGGLVEDEVAYAQQSVVDAAQVMNDAYMYPVNATAKTISEFGSYFRLSGQDSGVSSSYSISSNHPSASKQYQTW